MVSSGVVERVRGCGPGATAKLIAVRRRMCKNLLSRASAHQYGNAGDHAERERRYPSEQAGTRGRVPG